MNIDFTLVWSFRNRIDELKKSIQTAHDTSPLELSFCLVDGGSNDHTIKTLRQFVNTLQDRNIRVCESAYRTTCQEAWNLGIGLSTTKYVLITSSDCYFQNPGWFDEFQIMCNHDNIEYVLLQNHSLFGISKKLVAKIGWFDERYKNGPHVDCDYMIRSSEVGCTVCIIPNNNYFVHEDTEEVSIERSSSNVENRLPMNTLDNEEHFKRKWKTDWPGWKDHLNKVHKPHPPTTITEVVRQRPEVDPYPVKRQILKEMYNV